MSRWTAQSLTSKQCRALERYWFNAFDEWYITQKLNRFTFDALWKNYYKEAITCSVREPLLLAGLAALENASPPRVSVDDEFFKVVRFMTSEKEWTNAKHIAQTYWKP